MQIRRSTSIANLILTAGLRGRRRRSHGEADAPAGAAEVFKLYSQAKLGMMREALAKLGRKANERPGNSFTERPN